MVLVRMDLIWLSDLLNNNQTAVGIRVLTDRAKCCQHKCPAQVPNGANGAQQWSQEPIVQDQLRTRPGWLGAELGPDEIFLDAAYFHISLINSGVWLCTKHCHVDWDYTNMLELILGQKSG